MSLIQKCSPDNQRKQPLVKATVNGGTVSLAVECLAGDAANLGLGGVSAPFAEYLLEQLVVLNVSGELMDGPLDMRSTNAMLRLAASVEPQTEFEAAMAVQMALLHHMALDCGRRALSRTATFEGRALNINHAGKLTRSYALLLEALARSRGKTSSQVVRVEHVTINGGQAVVGAVAVVGAGKTMEVQPHEHEEHGAEYGRPESRACLPALPGAQSKGDALPAAGNDRAETLSSPRRRERKRRTEGK